MAARKKTTSMTEDDKRHIYQVLKRNFEFDEEHLLANLGWCFLREDIDKADYGFLKLKSMLGEMEDFISLSTKETGGVTQSVFSLREYEPFEKGGTASQEDAEGQTKPQASTGEKEALRGRVPAKTTEAAKVKEAGKEKTPTKAKEAAKSSEAGKDKEPAKTKEASKSKDGSKDKAVAAKGAKAGAGQGRVQTKALMTSATPKRVALPAGLEGARTAQLLSAPRSDTPSGSTSVEKSGSADKADKVDKSEKSSASSRADRSEKSNSSRPAQPDIIDKPDTSTTAEPASADQPSVDEAAKASTRFSRRCSRRVPPGKAFERFADLGSWPELLSTLAAIALDEPWDFSEMPGIGAKGSQTKRYSILHNYLRYTFYRLTLEDKVAYSDDESFAAFNTGLVDKHYEDIYACFDAADPSARQPWVFTDFCTAGTGRNGKRLVREMNPLPQPANYLRRKEDLLFDLEREVVCDIRHIVVDNVDRLPVAYLRDELASSVACQDILAGIEELGERGRAALFDRLRTTIANDPRLFTRLSNSINAAIEQARRQVRWNYKTAVPAYYPRTNSMNLLLPLNLTEDTTPDVALVVELQKSGNYQGQTVVTMAQAYRDARLLCRPYTDWLSPASIIDSVGDEDEEE